MSGRFLFTNRKGAIMEPQTETVTTPDTETVTEPTNPAPQPETGKSAEDRIKDMEAALKKANAEALKFRKAAEAIEAERKAKEEAELSETEKLRKHAAELEAELKAARIATLQRDAAAKLNLPAELAPRLKGETLEELEADARELAKLLPKQPQQPHVAPTNPGGGAAGQETYEQKVKRLLG
jgi:membrane protein involved in colicin uptake